MDKKCFLVLCIVVICTDISSARKDVAVSELIKVMKLLNGRVTSLYNLLKMKENRFFSEIEALKNNLTQEIGERRRLEARITGLNANCTQAFDLAVAAANDIDTLKETFADEAESRKELADDVDELWSVMSDTLGENGDINLDDIKNDIEYIKIKTDAIKDTGLITSRRIDFLNTDLQTEKTKINILMKEMAILKSGDLSRNETSCTAGKSRTNSGKCKCPDGRAGDRCERYIRDCTEGQALGIEGEGIYTIQPLGASEPFSVKCYMNSIHGGWTIMQMRRSYFQESCAVDFNRNWTEYKLGFGVPGCDYWIGNEHLHQLTRQGNYTLDVSAQILYSGKIGHTKYLRFSVSSELEDYMVNFDDVLLDSALDGFGPTMKGQRFSTADHGSSNCTVNTPSGWWFDNTCTGQNLNTPAYASYRYRYPNANQLMWPFMSGLEVLEYTGMLLRADGYTIE